MPCTNLIFTVIEDCAVVSKTDLDLHHRASRHHNHHSQHWHWSQHRLGSEARPQIKLLTIDAVFKKDLIKNARPGCFSRILFIKL